MKRTPKVETPAERLKRLKLAHARQAAADRQMAFIARCRSFRLPAPELEYRFTPPRLFRFDYSWPDQKIALEVDGGLWIRKGHSRPERTLSDIEKLNAATVQGWRVIRCVPDSSYRDSQTPTLSSLHVMALLLNLHHEGNAEAIHALTLDSCHAPGNIVPLTRTR